MDVPGDALSSTSTPSTPAFRALRDITFGSIAGMVSKVFEHPFDLTKVRLQSQVLDSSAPRFNGPLDCMKQTFKNEGIRGLYRGLPAPIVGAMAENATLFLSYRELQDLIRRVTSKSESQKLSLPELCVAAAGAGAVTSLVLTPVELVKCKMQVQMMVSPVSSAGAIPAPLPGPISILMSVIRTSGFRGLWLGQSGTFIRETGGGAAWFGTKEFVASQLIARRTKNSPSSEQQSQELLPWESALSGACAGVAFNLALFPADTVKSAIQTEEELRPKGPGPTSKSTFLGTFKQMYKAQGIRGLYAGCGITIARSVVSSAMIFVIYDELNRRFG